jgi:hypothetical protein
LVSASERLKEPQLDVLDDVLATTISHGKVHAAARMLAGEAGGVEILLANWAAEID